MLTQGLSSTLNTKLQRLQGASDPLSIASSVTYTDRETFWEVSGTLAWPDGSSGHLDGVAFTSGGSLEYYLLSHVDSGKLYLKRPAATQVEEIVPDYYVDSDADPGGDGSLASPYDSLDDLPSLSDGETIALARGSVFDGEGLDVTQDDFAIVAYGTGERPIIRGWTAATGWTQDGTYTNCYKLTTSAVEINAETTWVTVWQSSDYLEYVDDLATCNSTPGSYHVVDGEQPGMETNPMTIYVNVGGDPDTDGETYRISTKAEACTIVGDNAVIAGIEAGWHAGASGSIKIGGFDGLIMCCTATWGNRHTLQLGTGTMAGCLALDGYWGPTNQASHIICYISDALGEDVVVREIYSSVSRDDSNHLFCHNAASPEGYGGFTISRCYFLGGTWAINGEELNDGWEISNCEFVDLDVVFQSAEGPATFADCTATNVAQWLVVANGTGAVTLTRCSGTFNHTLHAGNTRSNCMQFTGTAPDVTLEYCIFDSMLSSGVRRWIYFAGTSGDLRVDHCSLDAVTYNVYHLGGGLSFSGDHNVYGSDDNAWRVGATTYSDLVEWRAEVEDEEHSVVDADNALTTAGTGGLDAEPYLGSPSSDGSVYERDIDGTGSWVVRVSLALAQTWSAIQTFASGIVTGAIKAADDDDGVAIQDEAGNAVLMVDTENDRVGVGEDEPATVLHVSTNYSTAPTGLNAGQHLVMVSRQNSDVAIALNASATGKCRIVMGDPDDVDAFSLTYDNDTGRVTLSAETAIALVGDLISTTVRAQTTNPGVSGQFWNDGGTVKISTG